jgi:tRNA modification GTPase
MEGAPGGRDTVVARATPPGRGALAVVRLSGPDVGRILADLGAGSVLEHPPRVSILSALRDPRTGDLLDRGLVTRFQAPASYTGEDMAELGLHGSPVVVARVLEACRAAGARVAEPGEFTRRAWLGGKLDRLQVEAVQDLVDAESPALHAVAVHQVEGGLSRRIEELRREVVAAEALLAHHLDFPDEDEPPTPVEAIALELGVVREALERLLATAPGGRLLREGATVVLAGRPNAGKSSLFNALVGEERALVSVHAGTTRDAVDAGVALEGFPFRLVDTAGLREEAGEIEALGIEVARQWIGTSRAVVWCRDAGSGPPDPREARAMEALVAGEGGEERSLVAVRTMVDLEEGDRSEWPPLAGGPWIAVSVRSGEGLDTLRAALVRVTFGALGGGADGIDPGHVVVRDRHRAALAHASREIGQAEKELTVGTPVEFVATHLEEAREALVELIGPVERDEVLDALFRSFCIGK